MFKHLAEKGKPLAIDCRQTVKMINQSHKLKKHTSNTIQNVFLLYKPLAQIYSIIEWLPPIMIVEIYKTFQT